MANLQKCSQAPEATNDSLNAIVNKALGHPKIGTHQGDGLHVNMPPTWDGSGRTPPGWTKQVVANYVVSPADSALPIPDALATQLQSAPAQALLTVGEQTTLAAAITGRVTVDLDAGGHVPKADGVAVAVVAVEEIIP